MTNMVEHQPWPKTPRLFRDCVITEKIDGTNAAVVVIAGAPSDPANLVATTHVYGEPYSLYAQSRNRMITPHNDNYGFAEWVRGNAASLAFDLGVGTHYGEWWGRGIQRGYGVRERHFALFNVKRFAAKVFTTDRLGVVPTLAMGRFGTDEVQYAMALLRGSGSHAAWQAEAVSFDRPEGVCVFHAQAQQVFKATFDSDGHKGVAA